VFGFLNRKKKDKLNLYELKSKASDLLKQLKETSTRKLERKFKKFFHRYK